MEEEPIVTALLPEDEWFEARCWLQGPLDPARANDAFNALALCFSNGAPVSVDAPFLGRASRLGLAPLPLFTFEELEWLAAAIFEKVDGQEGLTLEPPGLSLYTAVREAQLSIPREHR